MDRNEMKRVKGKYAEALHSMKNVEWGDAAGLYLQYGLYISDNIDVFTSYNDDMLDQVLYNTTHGWIRYLNAEIGKPVVYDFDLWADTMNFSKDLLTALGIEIKGITPLLEQCQGCFVAMFRIWYEDIKKEDFYHFFDGKPCPELPDMSDMRKTFVWAIDHDIPCHDMQSFMKYKQDFINNMTADDEIDSYMDMAKLRDVFDAYEDGLIEAGIPKEYLDENRLELRKVYFAAVAFYEMLPRNMDLETMLHTDPDKMDVYFNRFLAIHKFQGIDMEHPENTDEEVKFYYSLIFLFGLQTGAEILKIDIENGFSEESLFKEVIMKQMEKDEE